MAKKSNTTPLKHPPRTRASTSTTTAVAKKTLAPDLPTPDPTPAPLPPKTLASISDLRELAESVIDNFERRLNTAHSDAVKEINASISNVSKRFKIRQRKKELPGVAGTWLQDWSRKFSLEL